MRTIIVLIIIGVAFTVLIDAMKKRKSTAANDPSSTSQRLMTANEMPPTETGRLRVRDIVDSLKRPDAPEAEAAAPQAPAEKEEELPDPFDTKS